MTTPIDRESVEELAYWHRSQVGEADAAILRALEEEGRDG